jgi:polyhydroxyalkanoate synthase
MSVFLDEGTIEGLEKKMAKRGFRRFGNGRHLQHAARQRPDLVLRGQQLPDGQGPFPFDLLYWNSDSTRMPAAMHSFYLRNMYLGNKLKERAWHPGRRQDRHLQGQDACYFISTIEDHIAPWKSTYMGARLPSGPTKFVLGGSGHIAGINSAGSQQVRLLDQRCD